MGTHLLGFDQIRDQRHPARLLASFIRKNRIPHALIFTGIAGVGKKSAALAFAMVGNCENRPAAENPAGGIRSSSADMPLPNACHRCRSCRWIQAGNHPDVIRIEPAGTLIRIDQIRDLIATLSMKPYGSGLRVVIIADAVEERITPGTILIMKPAMPCLKCWRSHRPTRF